MKKIVYGVIAGFISALLSVALYMNANFADMMMLESQSKYDFKTSIEKFKAAVKAEGWKNPKTYDLQKTMKKSLGKDVLAVKIFELCQPHHAYKILAANEERIVSAMMPCRVAIYEKEDGKVYISRMNSGMMTGFFNELISSVMKEAAHQNENMIKVLLK